jgi:ubiquinone biosynthesis protein
LSFFKISDINRTYRHIQRYRQIIAVLSKYGFGDLITALHIEQYIELGLKIVTLKQWSKIEELPREVRVRMVLEELGPTFLKMGQILSTRTDLIPAKYITELSKLQDDVVPFDFDDVKNTVEKELNEPIEQIFSYFEEKPVAAASIGQVHKAVMPDGSDVVVKVQRPGIKKIIEVDLEIMTHLAGLMETHLKSWDVHKPTKIIEEFARTLEKELDYTQEAANTERFARQFENNTAVYVPKIFHSTTTSSVLTMEFVQGIKVTDSDRLERDGYDKKILARRGFSLILEQILIHGFFHADPHPGNIFVLPDNVICYIDFGMMGRVGMNAREAFADFLIGVVRKDERLVTKSLLKLTNEETGPDYFLLENDITEFLDLFSDRPLNNIDFSGLMFQFLDLIRKHKISFPPNLFLMFKAVSTAESIGQMLDPELDVVGESAPFIKEIQLNRINPKRLFNDFIHSGNDLFLLLKEIPAETATILKMLKKGNVKIEFEHRGLEPVISAMDRVSSRIAFAMILASLVVGSALIVLSGVPPKWHGIPVIGLAGFLIAGIMGFGLLLSILRRRKM